MVEDDVIVAWLFKAKSTVAGNDKQGVSHLILDTHPVYHCVEFSMNVAADYYVLRFGK